MASESSKPISAIDQPEEMYSEETSAQGDETRDGPTITRCFEIYGANTPDELDFVKSMGFNQVILDYFDLAEPAESRGLSVVLGGGACGA